MTAKPPLKNKKDATPGFLLPLNSSAMIRLELTKSRTPVARELKIEFTRREGDLMNDQPTPIPIGAEIEKRQSNKTTVLSEDYSFNLFTKLMP